MTDLIVEHYAPIPGKGIELLRRIYKVLSSQGELIHKNIVKICQSQFDKNYMVDEFTAFYTIAV